MKRWLDTNDEPTGYVNKTQYGYIKLKSGFVAPIEYQVAYKSSA